MHRPTHPACDGCKLHARLLHTGEPCPVCQELVTVSQHPRGEVHFTIEAARLANIPMTPTSEHPSSRRPITRRRRSVGPEPRGNRRTPGLGPTEWDPNA